MHQQGYKQQAIADALGLTQGAVSYIIKRAKAGGMTALHHHKSPGAPARLSAEQKQQLLAALAQGAEAHGFHGDVWTTERIAQFIAQRFGVSREVQLRVRRGAGRGFDFKRDGDRILGRRGIRGHRRRTETQNQQRRDSRCDDRCSSDRDWL